MDGTPAIQRQYFEIKSVYTLIPDTDMNIMPISGEKAEFKLKHMQLYNKQQPIIQFRDLLDLILFISTVKTVPYENFHVSKKLTALSLSCITRASMPSEIEIFETPYLINLVIKCCPGRLKCRL